ncbi:type IV secretion system DNA-binding domain-containing protein [Candidatus Saccharibacteria bacterium]|nr:type IV secretion system DNA-binding domain-containing protein [Candidatus Saccharibacteria bacterium]
MTGHQANDENISAFGLTNFRGINHQFGMLRRDRSRHVYIIGQTGAGKSGLLELFALSDTFYNQGYCIIDPHGDFATDNLRFIPKHRIKDVVYFNPADTQYPVAFNPLELSDATRKPNVCSEVIGVLKRMFGDSWGPRLEHILRYTLLALLDRPETTLLDISRMLTDKEFRKETLDYCQDVTVLQFWKHEFGQWNEKQINESIAPVLNKVGAFTANPIIRNIIGQPKSSFNVRQIMDEGKILIVNLSKGLIGEDNAGILGAFLVTKIQLAAMSRSDIPDVANRRPFYLYVDEFQNFATESFSVILSEARKYGLNLTVANQYISQMTEQVRDAVFGNVGTTISFRVSADDAPILVKQFEPTFEAQDLLQMNNRNFVISMIINGEKVPAFSATSLNIPQTPQDNFDEIVVSSRERYSRPRSEVEAEIKETIEQSEKYKKELSDSGRLAGEQGTKSSWGSNYGVEKAKLAEVEGPKPTFIVSPDNPAASIKKAKLSPNKTVGKESAGLKDLKKILEEKKEAEKKAAESEEQKEKQGIKPLNPQEMPAISSLPKAPVEKLEKAVEVKSTEKKELSHIKEKAEQAEAPKSHEQLLGNDIEKNPFKNNERNSRRKKNRNKHKKNGALRPQEAAGRVSVSRVTNFASDLHDGRPGVATSQNVPSAHKDGLYQSIHGQGNTTDGTDSGFLSIHH